MPFIQHFFSKIHWKQWSIARCTVKYFELFLYYATLASFWTSVPSLFHFWWKLKYKLPPCNKDPFPFIQLIQLWTPPYPPLDLVVMDSAYYENNQLATLLCWAERKCIFITINATVLWMWRSIVKSTLPNHKMGPVQGIKMVPCTKSWLFEGPKTFWAP